MICHYLLDRRTSPIPCQKGSLSMNTSSSPILDVERDPRRLRPWPTNPRRHSRKQRRQLASAIRRFGFTSPVLIDEADTILAGHGRVEAAIEAGLTSVPCRV